ncbi:MAG: hypothetical protein NT042_15380 [Sulfuritalea sp.]|nr:hypothetical protein [Sulfuritalea sp.]
MANADGNSSTFQGCDLATADAATQELIVAIHADFGFSEYYGTRAQLEEADILPDGIEWPKGYADIRWQSEGFDYWIRRERPPGAKGPRKQFIDCDWWMLRWELTNQPSHSERYIKRKAKELSDAIYRESAKGRAEWDANWERYLEAKYDKRFQAFKVLTPGLVPAKRGRPAKDATLK